GQARAGGGLVPPGTERLLQLLAGLPPPPRVVRRAWPHGGSRRPQGPVGRPAVRRRRGARRTARPRRADCQLTSSPEPQCPTIPPRSPSSPVRPPASAEPVLSALRSSAMTSSSITP